MFESTQIMSGGGYGRTAVPGLSVQRQIEATTTAVPVQY
eukprot:SAG31_NODE_7805_length_1593_cov_1.163989_1_plen_39_part_00